MHFILVEKRFQQRSLFINKSSSLLTINANEIQRLLIKSSIFSQKLFWLKKKFKSLIKSVVIRKDALLSNYGSNDSRVIEQLVFPTKLN